MEELDPNQEGRGLAAVREQSPKQLKEMRDNYDFVMVLLDTEMRYDDMAKLPWSAVDVDTGSLRIYRNKVDLADTFT
ncbi:MAG: hypothetical protein ACREYF_04835 [Gammaproteobacteria bacterium]